MTINNVGQSIVMGHEGSQALVINTYILLDNANIYITHNHFEG
jgi:hypothetical protein